jgi:predicted polyphosphate/ATP-dependent NAD kinase
MTTVAPVTVGVIANPASGRDIRRLVTGASVFDNAEKGSMVHRLMTGLSAAGVERVLMMPAGSGLSANLGRRLRSTGAPVPRLDELAIDITETAADSVEAVRRMREAGVAAIVVLGGDGTHRVVARECGEIPICALSTGTNNAFPEMRETTVAGLATGLLATGRLRAGDVTRRAKMLRVRAGARSDIALVDVAATTAPVVGARALWRIEQITQVYCAFAEADAVGLSAIAAQVHPAPRDTAEGVAIELGDGPNAVRVGAAIAPGLVADVAVASVRPMAPEQRFPLPERGSLALDGEREIPLGPGARGEVWLDPAGPRVLDVAEAMRMAAREGLLNALETGRTIR